MKLNYLIKTFPLSLTFILIFFLCFTNQKEYTKLRLLIWNSPSLTLGNYLAISTGAGFIFSYIITTNLANIPNLKTKNKLEYKTDNNNYYIEKENITSYSDTLIERDLSDPPPTVTANFRVIGNIDKSDSYNNDYFHDSDSMDFEEQIDKRCESDEDLYPPNQISSDWNDESFLYW